MMRGQTPQIFLLQPPLPTFHADESLTQVSSINRVLRNIAAAGGKLYGGVLYRHAASTGQQYTVSSSGQALSTTAVTSVVTSSVIHHQQRQHNKSPSDSVGRLPQRSYESSDLWLHVKRLSSPWLRPVRQHTARTIAYYIAPTANWVVSQCIQFEWKWGQIRWEWVI